MWPARARWAGFGSAVGLVAVTSGVPLPGVAVTAARLLAMAGVVGAWLTIGTISRAVPLAASTVSGRQVRRLAWGSAVVALALPPAGHGAAALIAGYGPALLVATAVAMARRTKAGAGRLSAPAGYAAVAGQVRTEIGPGAMRLLERFTDTPMFVSGAGEPAIVKVGQSGPG